MYALINAYWWLVFPLSWFAVSAWRAWLSYSARRDAQEVVKAYARDGREAPAAVLAQLGQQ
jgi:hypothetical protein